MAEKAVETKETEMNEGTEITDDHGGKNMKERKLSWAKLRRVDSLNIEAGRVPSFENHASKVDSH
jgi:KUP system potassium uptake protein